MLKEKILNYLQENEIENSDDIMDIYQIYSDIYSEFQEFDSMYIDFAWQEDHYIMAWITTDWWDTLYYDIDVYYDFDNHSFYKQVADKCVYLYASWKEKQIEYSRHCVTIISNWIFDYMERFPTKFHAQEYIINYYKSKKKYEAAKNSNYNNYIEWDNRLLITYSNGETRELIYINK